MAFVLLTSPDGYPVLVRAEHVEAVRKPTDGEASPKAKTIIEYVSGHTQAVRESIEEVREALE